MVGAPLSWSRLVPLLFVVISCFGKDRTVVAQTVKAKPFCVEESFQNRCLEALVCQEVAKVGQPFTITPRVFDSKTRQAEADTEIQHSEYAECLEMPVLLGASGRSSESLQGLQSTLETSRLCVQSKGRQWRSNEISKQEEAQQTGIKFERCGELREEQKQGGGDGIHEQVALGGQFPPDKGSYGRTTSSSGDRSSCFDRTSDASFPKCRGGHQPSSSTSAWAQTSPWISSSRIGGKTPDIRGEDQRSCSHARALEQIGKNQQAAQGDRHPTDCNGRGMDFLFQACQRQVRAAQVVVPSVPRRTTESIYREESGASSCKGADSAGFLPALSRCLAQSATGGTSHGCSGRSVQRNNGGRPNDSRTNGSHVSIEYPTRSNGWDGWDGGDLRWWSKGYRSIKAVSKERCTQAIQSWGSTFSEQGCPTALEAEGNRKGEEQKSYYTELNDIGIGCHDDSLEALLQNGPEYIQNGIVTFCDQVEIREFVPEVSISGVIHNNDGEDDAWSNDPLSEGFCPGWSNAPCLHDLWCAELYRAASSEDVDQDSCLGMFADIFDELLTGPNFDSHTDIEMEADYSSLMQAHHQTSLDKVNLQALTNAAPPSGSFLVTIWAVEYGMGSPSSSTIRLNRGQENTWVASILGAKPQVFRGGSITDSKPPQIVLVDPQPTPSPTELVSDFHGKLNLHVIVDTFSHNCVPVLLDRVREGRWIDRKAYAMRVQTVADIFDRVGWRQDLQNENVRCTLDDAGVLYESAEEVDLFGGYFGTLHVTPNQQAEPDSSSTSYGTCDSDIAIDRSDDEVADDFASFQVFAQFIDREWNDIVGLSNCATNNSNTSFRNEREEDGGQALVPANVDEGDGQEGYEQGESEEESPDLLDIPVMSRVWHDVEETMRANCNDEGGYPLVTFGLGDESLGRRDLEVRSLDPHVLRNALYEVWEDCVPQHATLEIHFVHPQPLSELQIEKGTILIVEVFEDDTYDELRPVLSIACNEHNALVAEPKPSHFRTPTFVQYAKHLFPHSHLCRPHGCRECEIRIAGRHVVEGNAIPFTSGSLIKLSLGPLPADLDQAQSWMPQYEVFLNHFNQHAQDDATEASLVFHDLHSTATIPVAHSVVNHPQDLWAVVSQVLQSQNFIIHYTSNGQVGLADTPNVNAYHFVVAIPNSQTNALVVTRSCDEDGCIRPLGVQLVSEDQIDNMHAVHSQISQAYGISQDSEFQSELVDPIIDRSIGCQGAQVVLHTVYIENARDRERSRSPRRQSGGSQDHGNSETTSLLQVKHVVFRQGATPTTQYCPSTCEFAQRDKYVQAHPGHFDAPMSWSRVPVNLKSIPDSVVDVLSHAPFDDCHTNVVIVLEIITDKGNRGHDANIRTVIIPSICSLKLIAQKCGLQNMVFLAKHNGSQWGGRTKEWKNGDLITLFLNESAPKWKVVTFCEDRQTEENDLEHHTVFFDDTCETAERVDFVGSQQELFEWYSEGFQFVQTKSHWKPTSDRHNVWLASKGTQDCGLSVLLGVLQPSGRTAWEHKRIPKGELGKIVPSASRHCFFCDGVKITNNRQRPEHDGEVIVCLIHACSDICRGFNQDPSSKGPSEELAPCQSDRWCASSDLAAGVKGREDSRKPTKVRINIEAALTFDESNTFTLLPGSERIEHQLNNYALQDVIVPLPDGVKLKLSSAKAIWDAPQCHYPQLLELYIDGSSTNNGSGGAIVAVATDWCNNRSFLGCAAGQIEIEPQNPQWIGAQSKDNIAAEVSALVVAQVIAIISNFPTVIRPDLQFSRHLVQGSQTTDKIGPIVEVSQLLAAWGAKHVQEVRAHRDDPFNELADSLAKWAADTGESCGSVPFCTPHDIASRHDRSSLWIHTMPHCFAGTLPVQKDGNFLAFTSNRKIDHETDNYSDLNSTAGEFACKVVTFNAQSIREDKKNQSLPRRDTAITSRLDLQWHAGGAAIVGIQESRTPEGSFRSRHYEIFSSGADQTHDCPHFGCEVWFHKQIPIVSFSDRRYFSADFKKVVIHKDPRRLVVRCSSDPMTFVVASLHAPCLSQSTTIQQIKKWWNETCTILQKIGNCCHQILCVDANAPLGPDGNSVIGQCGAEANNAQSHVVHEAIDKLEVCVPSTCPDCHVGPTATWRHPKGKWMRRDYVFVSRSIQSWCQKSYVDLSFDSGKSHIDHLPVSLEMRGFVQGIAFSKPPKIDVSKVSNPECRHAFQQAWKGGNLVALFKGKGSYADPKAYRSIFISDVTAKVYHANLRSKLEAAWMKSMDALQFGGRKGCSPDFAHHILHSFLAWSRVKRMPAAAVFVDLRSAFYSVLRQGLFEGEISDQHVCQAMAQLGVSSEEFHEIAGTVQQEAATAGIGPHADLLFRNLFCATHFRMAAIDQPCHTAKGTRPGDPIADVLFNMSMMLILRSVRVQVNRIADFSNVVGSVVAETVAAPVSLPPKGYLDVAFVDDCVFMTFAPSNEQMMQQTKLLQSMFHDEARKRGLSVNYEKGKTEVIVQCCGPNTRLFKKNLLIEGKASVPIVCENETYQLRVVHGYKHLGSFVQEGASIEWDRRKKVAQARQAWWTLKRSFFNKKAISSHVKTTVFNAIVKSRALYNAHVWSWISLKDVEHWNDSIREMFSPIVKRQLQTTPAFKYTSAQLCALAGILDFQDQLHVNRLMYLCRMMEKAPAILWTFIVEVEAPQGWLQHLRSSLQWLVNHYPGRMPFTMEEDTVDIIQKIALDGRWRAKVKFASRSAVAYYKRQADGLIWTRCMQAKLEDLGCLKEVPEKLKLVCWQCELCNAGFDSKRGLAMHSHSVHGYLREAKHYIVDDKCNACGKIFHTRARAIAHVESNPRCMQCYRSCMVPVDEETMQQVEDADRICRKEMREKGWKPTKALKPIVRMVGPTFPPSGTADAEEMRRKWTRRVESTNRATFLQGFLSGQGEEQEDTAEGPPFILDTVGGEVSGHGGCAQNRGPAFLAAQVNCKTFFFVHFFSGYRREKDLHWQIENQWVGEGWQVYCISIDLCLCREHSDLTSRESYEWWLQKAKDGYVIGAGGGPPCETYSAARLLPEGPPPLRSANDEWGNRGLTKRQHVQVEVGSKLVQFLVTFITALVPLGLCGFIEHPAFPCWAWPKHPVSIWANSVIRLLSKLDCCTMTTFDQCTLGAKVKKPTGLLLLRLHGVRQAIRQCGHQGRCNHAPGSHPRLQGKDKEGKYRTSWAKVYPEGLNRVLADGICTFAAELRTGSDLSCLEDYPSFFWQFRTEEFVESHVVQRDYHEACVM